MLRDHRPGVYIREIRWHWHGSHLGPLRQLFFEALKEDQNDGDVVMGVLRHGQFHDSISASRADCVLGHADVVFGSFPNSLDDLFIGKDVINPIGYTEEGHFSKGGKGFLTSQKDKVMLQLEFEHAHIRNWKDDIGIATQSGVFGLHIAKSTRNLQALRLLLE